MELELCVGLPMGKFDNYSGGKSPSRLPAARSKPGEAAISSEDRHARYRATAKAAEAAGIRIDKRIGEHSFVFALDATGSMSSLIDDAKRNVTTIFKRIYEEAKAKVRVRMYVYRDYDVGQDVCESSSLTDDPQELEAWLARILIRGGGANEGEAIEAALEAAYRADEATAVLLAGDEPSNPRADLDERGRRETPTAHDWARRFAQRGVPIHTFVVGSDPRTSKDFQQIAKLAEGQTGILDGSDAMIDMAVMAMLSSLKGAASVRSYMERHKLTQGAKQFGNLLLAGPKSH
jgi:hypothetical protein